MKKPKVLIAAAIVAAFAMIGAVAVAHGANATGQVTKIDNDAGKVTIKHGPIKEMDMPDPMTMVYPVKDKASLGALKAGDNVKFELDHDASGYFITHIEKK